MGALCGHPSYTYTWVLSVVTPPPIQTHGCSLLSPLYNAWVLSLATPPIYTHGCSLSHPSYIHMGALCSHPSYTYTWVLSVITLIYTYTWVLSVITLIYTNTWVLSVITPVTTSHLTLASRHTVHSHL